MYKNIILKISFILLFFSSLSFSQQMKIISGGEIAFVPEITGIIQYENNKLKIASINNAAKGNKKIDLQPEDEILFVNGNRVKSLESFNKYYEMTEIGAEVKFGVKRENQMLIATFIKEDPSKSKHRIMRMEGEPGTKIPEKIEMKNGKILMDGKETNIDSLKRAGIKIKTKSTNKKNK